MAMDITIYAIFSINVVLSTSFVIVLTVVALLTIKKK
jgi:hypothetical protein